MHRDRRDRVGGRVPQDGVEAAAEAIGSEDGEAGDSGVGRGGAGTVEWKGAAAGGSTPDDAGR